MEERWEYEEYTQLWDEALKQCDAEAHKLWDEAEAERKAERARAQQQAEEEQQAHRGKVKAARSQQGYTPRAVQFHPGGGQFDFVWPPPHVPYDAPHGAYVW